LHHTGAIPDGKGYSDFLADALALEEISEDLNFTEFLGSQVGEEATSSLSSWSDYQVLVFHIPMHPKQPFFYSSQALSHGSIRING